MKFVLPLVLTVALGVTACAPEPEPAIDRATVTARFAAVRSRNSATSRTVTTLEPGDHVDILEQIEDWYRIRIGGIQGWMQQSTVVTETTQELIRSTVAASQGQIPQNTAALASDGNLRIEPGRSTAIVRKLDAGTPVEVLDRVTIPREGATNRGESWLKVRPTPTEVGWVLSTLITFDVPPEIAQYTEGYTYAAVKSLNQVQDSIVGTIHWYVIGERRPGADPAFDYDGIRVFTWNQRRHRYETAYRARNLRGVYPLEVGQESGKPSFRIHEISEDGQTKIPRSFIMNGVIVQEVSADPDKSGKKS